MDDLSQYLNILQGQAPLAGLAAEALRRGVEG